MDSESTSTSSHQPWEQLKACLESNDRDGLIRTAQNLEPSERARTISRLDLDERQRLLTGLSPRVAADWIKELPSSQAAEIIGRLEPVQASGMLAELASDERADLLAQLDERATNAILQTMSPEEAASARQMVSYDPATAGGLMIRELLCYPENLQVRDVLADLRENNATYSDYEVQYAYVVQRPTNADGTEDPLHFGKLVGVLRMRDLLLSDPATSLAKLMIKEPLAAQTGTTLDELSEIFDRRSFLGLPIVDPKGHLVGVVLRHDVEEARANRADDDNLKLLGIIGGEELRTMPLATRAGWRLSWLIPNIFLNVIAISVIALFESTLEQVISLAVLLPLISDMGGNAGIQAIAVSIRELNLGLLRAHEIWWVALKEGSVGLINGVILGAMVAAGAWIWQGNPYLGLVIGVAMAVNTLVATMVGGVMPLCLKRFHFDPALASGPVLTTITDMSGFFLVLSLATLVLPKLI